MATLPTPEARRKMPFFDLITNATRDAARSNRSNGIYTDRPGFTRVVRGLVPWHPYNLRCIASVNPEGRIIWCADYLAKGL